MNLYEMDDEVVGQIAAQVANRIQLMFSMDQLWLSVEDYARFHGLSAKTVRRAIEGNRITVKKGGLAPGSDLRGARKRIHRYYDSHLEKVVWPK